VDSRLTPENVEVSVMRQGIDYTSFLRLASSNNPADRHLAMRELYHANCSHEEKREILHTLFLDAVSDIRVMALQVARFFGNEKTVQLTRDLLSEAGIDDNVEAVAIKLYCQLVGSEALPFLLSRIENKNSVADFRSFLSVPPQRNERIVSLIKTVAKYDWDKSYRLHASIWLLSAGFTEYETEIIPHLDTEFGVDLMCAMFALCEVGHLQAWQKLRAIVAETTERSEALQWVPIRRIASEIGEKFEFTEHMKITALAWVDNKISHLR
jgi:hypothetical protein